jgi:AcrR family transcriptional regulator
MAPPKKREARAWAKLPERSTRWKAQREALLQAAQRAIHRIGPNASMDEIAAEAGITKPIVYRHFGDRRGLARALRDQAFVFVVGDAEDRSADARRAARERVAALYPVVDDADALRRVVVAFGTGFQMFVEFNSNLYRFLRIEGVLDTMWAEEGDRGGEPVAESLAKSLEAIFGSRGVDATTALIWAHGLRGMIGGIVDWWIESRACDRFQLEQELDVLTRATLSGLDRALSSRSSREPAGASRRGAGKAASAAKKTAARGRGKGAPQT